MTASKIRNAIGGLAGTAITGIAMLGLMVPAGLSSASQAPTQPIQEEPSFSGIWELNPEESDDPREKLQQAMAGARGQSGERGGGRGGMGGFGGGGRPPGGGGGRGGGRGGDMQKRMEQMRETMQEAVQAAQELQISLEAGEFRVTDSYDRLRIYYLDGEKHKRETPAGVNLETISERKGDRIVIKEKTEQGVKFNRTYELAQDGSVMVVTVQLENKGMKEPVVIRAVYDSVRENETLSRSPERERTRKAEHP